MSEKLLLKKYASFLSNNFIDDLLEYYISQNKELPLPFLNFYRQLSNKDFIRGEVEHFLSHISHWKIFTEINEWINHLNDIHIHLFKEEGQKISDILLIFENRKHTLLHFLPNYTSNVNELMELVEHINFYFSDQTRSLINSYDKVYRHKEDDLKQKLISAENNLHEFEDFVQKEETFIHAGHCVMDFKSGKVQCSEEFYKIFGLSLNVDVDLNTLVNMTVLENGYKPFSTSIIQGLTEEHQTPHEFKIKRSDQKIRTLLSQDYPLKSLEGELTGIKSIIHDITDIKEAEIKVKENENLLKEIIESSPTIIWIYDLEEDQITFINSAARKTFGYSLDYLLNLKLSQSFHVLFYADDIPKMKERIKGYGSATEHEYNVIEFRFLDAYGNPHWVQSKAIIFKKENDKIKQVLVNAVDINSLKKVEEQLQYREVQLLTAQKIAHAGSFEWDIKNNTFKGTEELFGILDLPSDKEYKVSDIAKYLNPSDIKKYRFKYIRSCKLNIPFEGEFGLTMPGAAVKHVLIRTKAIHNSEGEIVKSLGVVMDITSLKKTERKLQLRSREIMLANRKLQAAEQDLKKMNAELEERVKQRTKELKESKERYEVFVRQSSIGLCRFEFKDLPFIDITLPTEEQVKLINEHTYMAETNDHLAYLFGVSNFEELIGHKLKEYVYISDEDLNSHIQEAILSDYKIHDLELTTKRYKKNPLFLHIKIEGVVENNRLLRAWGIVMDISSRKYSEMALRESEERYKILTEAVPGFIWTTNSDGEVDFLNQRWLDYSGTRFEEGKGWGWKSYVHPDDIENTMNAWTKSIQSGKRYEIEFRLRRHDGEYRWFQGRALPIKDDSGKIIKWIGISTDIEDKINSEVELKQKNEDLDNFIYMASHDLKAPVANIEGLVEALNGLINEEDKQNGVGEILDMIGTSIGKFRKSLLELIEITKSQQGSTENIQENYLPDILQDVEGTLDELIKKNEASVQYDFNATSTIKFARKNLQSIIYNLLSNAIKYRSPDRIPEICIKTELVDSFVVLSVKDNGLGLEKEQAVKIFSEFKRLHEEIEGSGVGLYIVKRIITNAGGKIEVESEKGIGSVFKVYFKV